MANLGSGALIAVTPLFTAFMNRCCNNSLNRPAQTKASNNGACACVEPFAPVRRTQGFTSISETHIVSLIVSLFFRRSPLTVLGGVVLIIVDAFDGILGRRTLAHVFKEVLKRCSPMVANRNAPTTVVGMANGIGILTSLHHANPNLVLGHMRPVRSVQRTSLFVSQDGYLPHVAPTRRGVASGQLTGHGGNTVTAHAVTQPALSTVLSALARKPTPEPKNCQAAKSLTRQILANSIEGRHWIKANSFNLVTRAVREVITLSRPAFILTGLT